MFRVIKKQGKIVEAYRLGEESRMIRHLMEEGKIIEKGSGIFEVFSQEAVHGSGEIAYTGDFIKVDASGMPYPNTGGFFLKNHRRLGLSFWHGGRISRCAKKWNFSSGKRN